MSRWSVALRVLVIAAVVAGLAFFIRGLDAAKLAEALGSARLWPLALAAVLNFGCLWGKAVSWRLMLAPKNLVPVGRLFRYTIAAFAASAIAPARAGEVLRVWTLKRRDGVPVADTVAVALAEKLLDGTSMLILVAPLPWLVSGLPSWVERSIVVCAAVALAAFAGLYIALAVVGAGEGTARSWLQRFVTGMHVLRSPARLFSTLAILIGVWLIDLAMVTLVLYAVGIDLPIGAGLLILFTVNLTIMLPSTPAQVGALEVGALAALDLLHVPHEPALAFALLYHVIQVVPLLAVGLVLELNLVLGRVPAEPPATG